MIDVLDSIPPHGGVARAGARIRPHRERRHDVQDEEGAVRRARATSTSSSRHGEFVALIGHSGCGKSTLLNLVAGLLAPSHGVLLCAGREIAGPGPERGVVFQNHSLLPWLTCFDNVHLAVERVFGASEIEGRPEASHARSARCSSDSRTPSTSSRTRFRAA